jgi:elongator complex protein 3
MRSVMDLFIFDTNKKELFRIIKEISLISSYDPNKVSKILINAKLINLGPLTKEKLRKAYYYLKSSNQLLLSSQRENYFLSNIKLKNIRTLSGVTPVTVMTMPYPCPGKCIYCPTELNVPKSYIPNEPGAQRAISNHFDPYRQTLNRLTAYKNNGHPTDKAELIIIGGTWSFYPIKYQIWFVKRCIDAMNDFSHKNKINITDNTKGGENMSSSYKELKKIAMQNESSKSRCIGMSIETRPDFITQNELIHLRKLGVTKVQLGVQSLDNKILKRIHRGHKIKDTSEAFKLLRQFGFKIQVHWMPNLLGSTPKKDFIDYKKLCTNPLFMPDEIKIYPCSLIKRTELMKYYNDGKWKPYSYKELKQLIKKCILVTPRYCRISRIIRDISSEDIFVGNKKSNLRQDVESDILKSTNTYTSNTINEIRHREIKNKIVPFDKLIYKETTYLTKVSKEIFMEMVDGNDRIAGFLRLSIPTVQEALRELQKEVLIRELHVYGQSLPIGESNKNTTQHTGVGRFLINKAKLLAKENNFNKISVISSIGSKIYYRKLGFVDGELYQHMRLHPIPIKKKSK